MAPGPRLQKINAALHREPYNSIAYCVFWLLLLCGVVPAVAAVVLLPLGVYRILAWRLDWPGADDFDPSRHDAELAIVITGCDTGFGRELALWAAEAGYVVFAGCLKEGSFKNFDFKEGSRVFPFVLDVTSDNDVANAALRVREWINEGKGKQRILHGLVNNAGISISGFFDWLEVSDYQKVMDVNYFGPLRCCKAFLPLLKEQAIRGKHTGSRIINLTSIAGLLPGNPVGSPYAASKHATQVFTESLRKELAVFGIQVTSVNPSFHNTPMAADVSSGNDIRRTWNKMTPELREEYGSDILNVIIKVGKKMSTSNCWNLQVVVDQVLKILKARETPGQLLVGTDARYLVAPLRMLPAWLLSSTPEDKRFVPAVMKKTAGD